MEPPSPAVPVPQSVSQVSQTSSSSMSASSSTPKISTLNMGLAPPVPSYQVPTTPGPPGISPSVPLAANVNIAPPSVDSSMFPRPTMQTAPTQSNNGVQQQGYTPYPTVSPMAASLQGPWLQPTQVTAMLRPPYAAYSPAFTSPFPLPARGMQLPPVTMSEIQPPGIASVGAPSGTPTPMVSSSQATSLIEVKPELPPGTDAKDAKNESSIGEELEEWTAHRTETGAVYYYNAITGESTYEKPRGFKGEAEKVTAQPTPVSWEKLAGTDWALVNTNDGKRYYYNMKTKLSSWQIPSELTELKKKHDADALMMQSMSVTTPNTLTEKGSTPITLSAPAINTGGRDATALRSTGVLGPSSALDLIKKKLQDSGALPTVSPSAASSGALSSEINGSKIVEEPVKGPESENGKDKPIDTNGENNLSDSFSDSEDEDRGPTKEECEIQFKEMLKERGVAPFSKWEKELPKIVFDPRFKAIPSHSARKALFDHYVRTRAEEERKEKRAAQRAAIEGFKKLLDEAKEDIDHNTDYQSFRKKWGSDQRFMALERKEREMLLNERILPAKKAAEEKAQATRAAAASSFKAMLQEKGDITPNSRWSKVKDNLRNDPRYKSIKHEDREIFFNQYISELKAAEAESERVLKEKNNEEEKLKERERALRKRKEREEQEVERVRQKARRKEAVESYQALLVEIIKDPQASWTESKSKLEKDPQGRAANPHLDQSDLEKLFREHVKTLQERCSSEFRALLAEVITLEGTAQETEDGKTALTSWSTAKLLLKSDARYTKMPRKDRESLWRRHIEEIQRRQKSAIDQETEKKKEAKSKSSADSGKHLSGSRRTRDRR